MESLKGKNVLLIGATGGIGAHTAKLLASSGANLFLTARNADKLNALASDCKLAEKYTAVADLTRVEEVIALHQRFFDVFDHIDILVNASGIGIIKTMDNLSEEEFRRSLDTNLIGPFLILQSFLPDFKNQKKGLIIHIPGVLGKTPMAGAAAYSASKYGLVGMLQSMREEVKRTEIRFTNLFLGGVDTAFWDNIDLRVQREKMVQAEEAARAIWFLCQQPLSGVVSEMVLQPFNHQAI